MLDNIQGQATLFKTKKHKRKEERLCLPTQLTIELQLNHTTNRGLAAYYSQIAEALDVSVSLKGTYYACFKILSFQELFWNKDTFLWSYMGISKRSKNKKAHYQYKAFIYKECPVFIDLKTNDLFPLYYYDFSEKELYRIQLTVETFLIKLFQCKGVDNWERLFIGKNYQDEALIERIQTVNPTLDIAPFLQEETL